MPLKLDLYYFIFIVYSIITILLLYTMKTDQFNYVLPPEHIAQNPHDPVEKCRLMVVDRQNWSYSDQQFDTALLQTLTPDSILFFNNSKVLKARIPLTHAIVYSQKETTNRTIQGELLYLGATSAPWEYEFLVRPGSKITVGTVIRFDEHQFTVVAVSSYGRILSYQWDIYAFLEYYGQLPLPPYVEYDPSKESQYQPIMASLPWSVASPTASLHFTQELLDKLSYKGVWLDYVTLHVGVGTFRSIDSDEIESYQIHSEHCQIDISLFKRLTEYALSDKITIAVWTTSCRTLESLPYLYHLAKSDIVWHLSDSERLFWDKISSDIASQQYINNYHIVWQSIIFDCQLYITPWFSFRIIDQLITNFHLPKSSLMVLVASFMWYDMMMQCYYDAIQKNYMFYSFGDAMWIQ